MDFQGDIFDEFLHQQKISRQGDQPPRAREGAQAAPRRQEGEASLEAEDGSGFLIPVLPAGQRLRVDIWSTWGDRHYVGLNGIEIFSSKGEPVQVARIQAHPPDINVLPAYGKDPRVVANLLDGVNRTQDDMHLWLAPFTPGKPHCLLLDFAWPCEVAMIRVWNYNKSRIHSFRGVKDVSMLLDEQCIFRGEIAKASGTLAGGVQGLPPLQPVHCEPHLAHEGLGCGRSRGWLDVLRPCRPHPPGESAIPAAWAVCLHVLSCLRGGYGVGGALAPSFLSCVCCSSPLSDTVPDGSSQYRCPGWPWP